MPTASPANQAVATLACTLASLASDTALLAGRASAAANNGTDDAIDAVVGGKVTTGTTPTASRQIEVWAYGSHDDVLYSGGATGADAALSPQGGAKSLLTLLTVIPTNGTSNQQYNWGPFSIANAFGGVMPRRWGIYIVHNTGVNLHATAGNHEIKYTPVKYESS